jgi:hypothetical protein
VSILKKLFERRLPEQLFNNSLDWKFDPRWEEIVGSVPGFIQELSMNYGNKAMTIDEPGTWFALMAGEAKTPSVFVTHILKAWNGGKIQRVSKVNLFNATLLNLCSGSSM